MIVVLVVSASFFAFTVVCIVFLLLALLDGRVKKIYIICLIILSILSMIACISLFKHYLGQVRNEAIQHYINGDYELVDIVVDGEIVDSYYQLVEIDYD